MRIAQTILLLFLAIPVTAQKKPNVILIFVNDLGYGDLGCFGHPIIKTPNIDKIAQDGAKLTKDYTSKVLDFIEKNKNKPFSMYYAPNFPHVPLYASKDFLGKSKRGLYGDVVEELDWSVGKIMETLKKNNLEENTLVIFTSDNGPWTTQGVQGGSAGLLKWGKGSCWKAVCVCQPLCSGQVKLHLTKLLTV